MVRRKTTPRIAEVHSIENRGSQLSSFRQYEYMKPWGQSALVGGDEGSSGKKMRLELDDSSQSLPEDREAQRMPCAKVGRVENGQENLFQVQKSNPEREQPATIKKRTSYERFEREHLLWGTREDGSVASRVMEKHREEGITQSKVNGSCKIYGWAVEDEHSNRLYKFVDPRVKLQAIGLWHRYFDVKNRTQQDVELSDDLAEEIAGICILISSKLLDSKAFSLNVNDLQKSIPQRNWQGETGKRTISDLIDLEVQFLVFVESSIQRDRFCLIYDDSHELLHTIKSYVGAGNAGSLLWNRLVDTFFIVACTPQSRQQLDDVPEPLLAAAFVAAAYGLTPTGDLVRLPGTMLYDLCNSTTLGGLWGCQDLEIVTNLVLDLVLKCLPDARYSFVDMVPS